MRACLKSLPINKDGEVKLDLAQQSIMKLYSEHNCIGNESNDTQEAENMQALLVAYWKTSSKRFLDTICDVVDRCIVRPLPESINISLMELLTDKDGIEQWFNEDPRLRNRRGQLKAKIDMFTKAQAMILDPGSGAREE